ncbi:hypothetical protein BpHYR1_024825 [Brachionus plicatilis]|uniref:Uncharacterized protein n=1 Tax=Brachionus plicatilis TaxID=10195 RepID=A0A3M7PP53_BRAPC|nr:hypothetical protein BpHYR1_024825 [Brachionus plicatilis]
MDRVTKSDTIGLRSVKSDPYYAHCEVLFKKIKKFKKKLATTSLFPASPVIFFVTSCMINKWHCFHPCQVIQDKDFLFEDTFRGKKA